MNTHTRTELPIVIYDCFSNRQFGGNIGGIVMNAGGLATEKMQQIAREINAPVTGFVTAQSDNEVAVRFFMPGAEIAMCGHVTVGLFTYLSGDRTGASEFVMKAQAGDVNVRVNCQKGAAPDVMMQLSVPSVMASDVDLAALADALGVAQSAIGAGVAPGMADAGLKHLFVQFPSLAEIQSLTPDFQKLTDVCTRIGAHTVACFSMETLDPGNTCHVRDFCPALGVDEVPASGTTNGALAGYLFENGLVSGQSQKMFAEQGSEIGRPSLVCSEIELADGKISVLRVGGQAVASIQGTIST